jgi:hypothetical protein
METKFCKHCQCEHPLTDVWWYFSKGKAYACIIQRKARWEETKEQLNPNSDKFNPGRLTRKRESQFIIT